MRFCPLLIRNFKSNDMQKNSYMFSFFVYCLDGPLIVIQLFRTFFLNKVLINVHCADMDRTLSELGFANRETLIVVPHQSTRSLRPQVSNSSINTSENASNANATGYFAYFRRLLSYVNPFSYLGGNTISVNPNAPTNSKFQFSILVLID
jgi:hypothetical protein